MLGITIILVINYYSYIGVNAMQYKMFTDWYSFFSIYFDIGVNLLIFLLN